MRAHGNKSGKGSEMPAESAEAAASRQEGEEDAMEE